jgi:predicted CXXCH cytochrome family protein
VFIFERKLTKLRWFFLAGLFLLILARSVTVVQANAGPHGGYTATNNEACASCHRAHTAASASLLINSVPNLCFSCHGSAATGADTNVVDGIYEGLGGGNLLSGGFVNFRGTPVSSNHSVNGTWQNAWGSGTTWTSTYDCAGCHTAEGGIWGPEFQVSPTGLPTYPGRGQNISMPLTCTSCHEPHGGRNYRALQQRLHPPTLQQQDPPGYVLVTSNETGGQNPNLAGYVPNYVDPMYKLGLGDWCTGCHFTYYQSISVDPFNAEDGKGMVIRYRHRMNVNLGTLTTGLPLEQPDGYSTTQQVTDQLFCLTCHFAHGSSATASNMAANVPPANDSALMRMDNRGVCEECHKK